MKPDSKGNIIVGTTAILIVMLLLMCIFIVSSLNYIQNQNIDSQANDNFKYIIDDYSNDIELLGRNSIDEVTQKVYNGLPVHNSENEIKKKLNNRLIEKNIEFKEKYDIDLNSEVISVENTDSPWKILFKIKLDGNKDNEHFSHIIERNASVEEIQ